MIQNFVREIEYLLEQVPSEQWQDPSICGIQYDLLPWHRLSTVTVQVREDDVRDPGGWKYYYSADSDTTRIQAELAEYSQSSDGGFVYHKLLLEAAEAMLMIDFTQYGQPHTNKAAGMRGSYVSPIAEFCLYAPFQIQVYDADHAFRFNYCEYVLARRLDLAKLV